MTRALVVCCLLLHAGRTLAAEPDWDSAAPRLVEQKVHEYFASSVPYSHLGAAYGLMGPGQHELAWQDGAVCARQVTAPWAGAWHHLVASGDARQALDFRRCYPPWILPSFQPRCRAVTMRAKGQGPLKVEIKGAENRLLWTKQGNLQSPNYETFRLAVPASRLTQAETLSWVLDAGATACIDSVGLEIEYPQIPFSERVFLLSYAKLARGYNASVGTVRDKAHLPMGHQEAVPVSGMFCLATCAAWKLDMVSRDFAVQTVQRVHERMENVPKSYGLLPHFLHRQNDTYEISPGSEYSTVDTALYYHSMLLAAQMLQDEKLVEQLTTAIRSIEFAKLRNPAGFVSHGVLDDGRILPSVWSGWGGETALVILLQAIAEPEAPARMDRSGHVYQGVGFIAEIQSLLFPQFSRPGRDLVSNVQWLRARRELFARQRAYFGDAVPAAKLGVFGLSAGEKTRGEGYTANGVDQPGISLIHPHYMLLSWEHWKDPADLYRVLRRMEETGLLPPWGLVENVDAELTEYLPFNGGLNASFECLSAYHLWAKANGQPDAIYAAAEECPPLRRAMRGFYR